FWWAAGKASRYYGPIERSWRHALAGRHFGLAEQAARVIHPTLHQAGRYQDSLAHAEEHLQTFTDSVYGLHWAGGAEADAAGPTARARERLEAALQGWSELHGADWKLDLAGTLHALGSFRREQGDAEGAREAHERALAIQIECYGTELESDVAASYHGLGCVLQILGLLPRARAALERALAIHRHLGRADRHPEFAASLHALGC